MDSHLRLVHRGGGELGIGCGDSSDTRFVCACPEGLREEPEAPLGGGVLQSQALTTHLSYDESSGVSSSSRETISLVDWCSVDTSRCMYSAPTAAAECRWGRSIGSFSPMGSWFSRRAIGISVAPNPISHGSIRSPREVDSKPIVLDGYSPRGRWALVGYRVGRRPSRRIAAERGSVAVLSCRQ